MADPNLMAQLQQVQQINFNRGRTRMGEIVDAVNYTCVAAEAGEPGARADLRGFLEALERSKLAVIGLASANGMPAPGSS